MTLEDFDDVVPDRSSATADLDREVKAGRSDGRLSTMRTVPQSINGRPRDK